MKKRGKGRYWKTLTENFWISLIGLISGNWKTRTCEIWKHWKCMTINNEWGERVTFKWITWVFWLHRTSDSPHKFLEELRGHWKVRTDIEICWSIFQIFSTIRKEARSWWLLECWRLEKIIVKTLTVRSLEIFLDWDCFFSP